eukprot:4734807-Alexandrium_andersonii.AAC.1
MPTERACWTTAPKVRNCPCLALNSRRRVRPQDSVLGARGAARSAAPLAPSSEPVSYTHLTLPTICSV